VSTIGTIALLLVGTAFWMFGTPTPGPDTGRHMLAPALLMLGVLVAAIGWLLRMQYGPREGAAAALNLAVVAPLAMLPATAFASPVTLAFAAVALPLSVVPLVLYLVDATAAPRHVRRNRSLSLAAIAAAVALTPLVLGPFQRDQVVIAREVLVAYALLAPIVLAATSRVTVIGAWLRSGADAGEPLRLTATALAPLVVRVMTAVPLEGAVAVVTLTAVGAFAFLVRFAMVPLSRVAAAAVRQRDQVAVSAEAERRRLAADLHDGPLQSLTLLAYRLEVAGDGDNAQLARDITTELRAITASLRLPVVDDLGTGPALEWLTERVGRLAGTAIDLEHRQDGRPPREVEHAIFRVAQEALANAARHGRPPIQVRYEANASHASLVVQDAGDGALVRARDGQGLGIVGMRERAHAIGADIELLQSSAGMKVSLVWPGATT
jgi:signal transduction histidine kinase